MHPVPQQRVPLLLEDGSSLDWQHAEYQAELTVRSGKMTVRHTLRNAPQLQALIDSGDAQWAVELRCPSTLFAQWATSATPEVSAEWNADAVYGDAFLLPGLIAMRETTLDPHGLIDLWGREPIRVPAGRWLVRGLLRPVNTLASSILRFHVNPDLPEGAMEVKPDTTGDLRFNVYLAARTYERARSSRDLQIAALIAASGQIPALDRPDEESDGAAFPVLDKIIGRLEEAGVPDWQAEANEFDPARAATAIEPFQVELSQDDDE